VQCDSDTALGRRLLRDISERGRDHKEVLTRYNKFVKSDFETYIKPYMKHADIIIPGGASNDSNILGAKR
jgi:uridine kinase